MLLTWVAGQHKTSTPGGKPGRFSDLSIKFPKNLVYKAFQIIIMRMKEELHSYCGKGVRMEGALKFRGALRFDGIFEGEITSADSLIVGKDGEVKASINVGSFFNMGEVVGKIHASKKIMIHAGSRLVGDINTPALVSEEGSFFTGKCEMPPRPTKDAKASKEAVVDTHAEILIGGVTPHTTIDVDTGAFSEPSNGGTRKKKLFAAGIAAFAVVALAGGYFFITSKTSMGVSFISRYMYERAAQNNPARLHAIADAYYTDGSFTQAARVYRRIKELGPADQITMDRLAESLEKSGAVDDAAKLYEEWLKANPHDRILLDKLVSLRKAGGNAEKLSALYESILESQPENSTVADDLFKLYVDNKKLDKALAFYKKKIASSPMTLENLKAVGDLEKQLGMIDDATNTYAQLVSQNESDKEAVLSLAYLYHKVGQEEKAGVVFAKLAKLDPQGSEAKVNVAMLDLTKGRLSIGVEILNGVLSVAPNNLRAMLALATAHSRLGDNAKAEQYCKQALAIDSESAPALNKIARVYMQQKKNLDEAEQYSVASMRYVPDLPDYMDTLAEIYFLKADYDKATGTMEKALKLRPTNLHLKEQMRKFSEAKRLGASAQ
jgi:tetratricopeptide (TPR) repeat protein/cytoskeletal protein CcmA (bactofilin family)